MIGDKFKIYGFQMTGKMRVQIQIIDVTKLFHLFSYFKGFY